MYVTTFYSFKGGVGRTLALVNVGVELAQTGRKVLLVDFDLEAPGIDTFDALRPDQPHTGVVEYCTRFISERSSPDAREYVYEAPDIGKGEGRLWIMPAGKGDGDYQAKLAAINWEELYRIFDGYLMFEDLKAQWREAFQPDYVLIDSRTGHSDIGGICTRQLPDAVVLLFFPNEQNLSGLKQVVSDIREEGGQARRRHVQLHFVMSNVPDLDDEEHILKTRMREFRDSLGYKSLTGTIHRYDSLALLNQTIFAKDRPRSRLAKEYKRLTEAVIAENPEDRRGAIRFLQQVISPSEIHLSVEHAPRMGVIQNRVNDILEKHSHDWEILFLTGLLREQEGQIENALALLDKASEASRSNGKVLLRRAIVRQRRGDTAGAVSDARGALQTDQLGATEVVRAARMVQDSDESFLRELTTSPALHCLAPEDRVSVVHDLNRSAQGQETGVAILRNVLSASDCTTELKQSAVNELMLCLIGLSRFSEAMQALSATRPTPSSLNIQEAFNYGMAEWGQTGKPPIDLFERVIELHSKEPEESYSPNYLQCLAVGYAVVGDLDHARSCLEASEERMRETREPDFSCWRYKVGSAQMFLDDCTAIRMLIEGDLVRPLFFRCDA